MATPPQIFPPTLREVMLRPRWIAMLALCLVVAGVFSWLGQWQFARAVQTNPAPPGATEQLLPLAEVTEPGAYLPEPSVGQRVQASGSWVPGDFIVVASRFNDGAEGYWVTGQFRLADHPKPTSLAVALGWAETQQQAQDAAAHWNEAADGRALVITGRLISDEGPVPPPPGAELLTLTRMSPAALLSRWHNIGGEAGRGIEVYRPYLITESLTADTGAAVDAGPLAPISSAPPAEAPAVNWLNVFYAAEWAIFAGFAFYLWYRLARDAWEREVEDVTEKAAAPPG